MKEKIFLHFFILYFLVHSQAFGQITRRVIESKKADEVDTSCSSIRLDERMPPHRNQSGTAWCYAYVAADLLSEITHTPISAVSLALDYNDKIFATSSKETETKEQSLLLKGYGSTQISIEASLKKRGGFCSENAIPSEDQNVESNFKWVNRGLYISRKLSFEYVENPKIETETRLLEMASQAFPLLDQAILRENSIVSGIVGDNLIRTLHQKACSTDHLVLMPEGYQMKTLDSFSESKKFDYKFEEGKKQVMVELDKILSRGRPVGIAVYQKFLTHDSQDLHAVSVVGREKRDGVCKYLLRNSFGPDYDGYQSEFESDRGHVWLTADQLIKVSTMNLFWLEK